MCRKRDHRQPDSGPLRLVCAIAASGCRAEDSRSKAFCLPREKTGGCHLDALKAEPRTMIFYEPRISWSVRWRICWRLSETGRCDRRELTKKFEEIIRTTLGEALLKIPRAEAEGRIRFAPFGRPAKEGGRRKPGGRGAGRRSFAAVPQEGMTKKEAVKRVAGETGRAKNAVYRMSLDLEKNSGAGKRGGTRLKSRRLNPICYGNERRL